MNLPLGRAAYFAVTEEGLRRVKLPPTERTHRLLFGKGDEPKPYKRVNIRLGASGKPTQYELLRYEHTEGEYIITLGEAIREVTEKEWVETIEAAMIDLIMQYLSSVKGYCVAYATKEYKKLCRQASFIIETYAKATQYSSVADIIPQARGELAGELRRDLIHIWRSIHASIDKQAKEASKKEDFTHMQAEALLGVGLCHYHGVLHRTRGRESGVGRHFVEISEAIMSVFLEFAAPFSLPTKALGTITEGLNIALDRYREKSQRL